MIICFKYLDKIYNIESLLVTENIFNKKLNFAKSVINEIKSNVFDKMFDKELLNIFVSYGNNRYKLENKKLIKIPENDYFVKSGIRNLDRNTEDYYIEKIKINDITFKICKNKYLVKNNQLSLDSKIKKLKNQLYPEQIQCIPNDSEIDYLTENLNDIFENLDITELSNNCYSIKIIEEIPIDILATKWNRQQINSRLYFIKDYVTNRFEEIKDIIEEYSANVNLKILKYNKTNLDTIHLTSLTNIEYPKIYYKFILG